VDNGTNTTITCKPVGGNPAVWPEGQFYVDITASATTELLGCDNSTIFSRKVNVSKKPDLNITAPPSAAVSDNKNLMLTYTVVDQANSGQTINVAPPHSCRVTGRDATTG
jgi:hypothetical protein